MNQADLVKLTKLPHRRGVTGSDLGPRQSYEVTEQGGHSTRLRAISTAPGVPPQHITLRADGNRVCIVCDDAKGLVSAGILAEHMRGEINGGPVTTAKDAGVFVVSFDLPKPPEPVAPPPAQAKKSQAEQA